MFFSGTAIATAPSESLSAGGPQKGRRVSIVEKSHGPVRCSNLCRLRSAGAVLRHAEHIRQYRELADHRLQGHQYQLLRPDPGRLEPEQAGRRRRHCQFASHQQHAGCDPDRLLRHRHGDQRRRLFPGAVAVKLQRQHAGVRWRRSLLAARRFPARRQRLSDQWRRLLPGGHSDRFDHRQSGRYGGRAAAVSKQLPAGQRDDGGAVRHQSSVVSAAQLV